MPEVRIGDMSFYRSAVQERIEDFQVDATITKDKEISSKELGKIGWEIFKVTNLFLDLGNSRIAFCDSLTTLKKQGYAVDSFVEASLISERGFIEIEADTSNGPLFCVLDTGSTWNILNTKIQRQADYNETIRQPENFSEIPLFRIAKKEFGPIRFHHIPIQLPIPIEAILGMDFFKEHVVFLDFTNNHAYFSKVQ